MTRQGTIAYLALVLLVLASSASAAGQDQGYYIWRSADGLIHISDTPPRPSEGDAVYLLPPEEESGATESAPSPQATPAQEQTPSSTPETPSQSEKGTAEAVDRNGHGREWWQARKQAILNEKAQCEAIYDSYARDIRKGDIDDQQKLAVMREKLALYRKKIGELETKLADLAEEARLSGAMPGWLR